ncbi:hypothetical protein [Methylorubrum salsuginis]|uniref:hypothetical protein n=1 Tax=Methylorubrum salsuginis TaxID=414703 RepID=UPI001041FBBF|nr:hypothetical protein [Methylorubrum salsuginis]
MTSFERDIRHLFRPKDITAMKRFGGFDLSAYEDVKNNAQNILEQISTGSMPCDGAWQKENIELFNKWVADGMQP